MKWQNLYHRKCPKCDSELRPVKDKAIIYECTGGCGFMITRRKMAETLSDPTHILRRFLSTEELYKLNESVEKMYL